ncbi:hypothetical protein ACWD6R_04280 [Streptomyces sp. NPDC005151]
MDRTTPGGSTLRHFTVKCDGETLSCAAAVPHTSHPTPPTRPAAVLLHGAGTVLSDTVLSEARPT